MPSTSKIIHYDSFGRSHRQLFPGRWEDAAVDTELDAEQDERATECGKRSLAWLLLFGKLGSSAAKMIYATFFFSSRKRAINSLNKH